MEGVAEQRHRPEQESAAEFDGESDEVDTGHGRERAD
jgi:hypothetical protein